jgi:hypothetical protein
VTLTHNDDYIHSWLPFHLFQQFVMQDAGKQRRFLHNEVWPVTNHTYREALATLGETSTFAESTSNDGRIQSVFALEQKSQAYVVLREWNNSVMVDIAAKRSEDIPAILAKLRKALPRPVLKKDDRPRLHVNFQTVKTYYHRTLDAAKWPDVKTNYPSKVREQLQRIVAPEFRPDASGQLLLWHGVPGTGKTWALRALGYEWRSWADMVYIVDPDAFFGDSVYMMNVLMNGGMDSPYVEDDDDEDSAPRVIPGRSRRDRLAERWRLLVAEDTGELLSADAKSRTGQGLSRLLNIVDGMIGQGLRVLVLITTNEKLGALHPAVTRPGRAAGIIEFDPFPPNEANEWLAAHNREPRTAKGDITLAELYNAKEKAVARKVGFAA